MSRKDKDQYEHYLVVTSYGEALGDPPFDANHIRGFIPQDIDCKVRYHGLNDQIHAIFPEEIRTG